MPESKGLVKKVANVITIMVKLNTMFTTVGKTRFKPPMSESYQSLKATSISPVNISYIRRFIRRTKESQITTILRDHNFQATKNNSNKRANESYEFTKKYYQGPLY